ncbi:hypothetical protein TNCV_3085011 [Trichonephila clavipes]|nr:hypothetical protein TNCV_3085011 [Trichonephila clavipes]
MQNNRRGLGSLVIKVNHSWLSCHELEPSTVEEPPLRIVGYSIRDPPSDLIIGLRLPSGQGIRSWPACPKFKPSTSKDPPCRGAMHVKSFESSNVLPLVWCGSQERGMLAQASSLSIDHGSKLRGPSPKTLV